MKRNEEIIWFFTYQNHLVAKNLLIADTLTGRLVLVTDGDTIVVLDAGNTRHKIRLTGIDAPERGQAYGTKSK
jgi:endonuclease YncB( thermonuclease family)